MSTEAHPQNDRRESAGEAELDHGQVGQSASANKAPLWDLWAGLLPLLALAPLLLYQAANLWSLDHMRFFPLTLLSLAVVIATRWTSNTETLRPPRKWLAICLFWTGIAVYAVSVWKLSPWLAQVAGVVLFTAWALGRFGNMRGPNVLAWTALLATTVPLPWGWDLDLLNWLYGVSAWSTSAALDALAIPCIRNGSVVETRGIRIVADEICGGLGGMFAFGSFAVLLGLVQHQSLWVTLNTLLLVPLWSLLHNFMRMFGVLIVSDYWGRDIASGWDFRLLEIGTSLLTLGLVWSTSRFFIRLHEPIPVAEAEFGPVFSFMNKFQCWPQPDPFENWEPEDHYEKLRYRKEKELRAAQQTAYADFHWNQHPTAKWLMRGGCLVLCVAAIFPARYLWASGIGGLQFGKPRLSQTELAQLGNEQTLPKTLAGGWQLVDFQGVSRNPRSGRGEFSLIWTYRANERQMDVSIDLPFLGWHDPAAQLVLLGWTVEDSRIVSRDDWPWGEIVLENELGGTAYLFHCLFTPKGSPYSLPDNPNINELSETQRGERLATQVTYQFQLLSETGEQLTDEQREELKRLFLELRNSVVVESGETANTPVTAAQ